MYIVGRRPVPGSPHLADGPEVPAKGSDFAGCASGDARADVTSERRC
jgi:hypothetical protein